MKRTFTVGEQVEFELNTGRKALGTVVQVITDERKSAPNILLLERPDGWRAFRLATEVEVLEPELVAKSA